MRIPRRGLEKFVRELSDSCLASQVDRINRGSYYKNYALYGADQPDAVALFNKTYAYLDDLESLLYSPISLRFHIGDPEVPNFLSEAKGRAASAKLRNMFRASDTDNMISQAVWWSLVKGKTFIKQSWKRSEFSPNLVQPEAMGVLYENHTALDQDMEAFVHTMLITPHQFERMTVNNPDRELLRKRAQRYQSKRHLMMAGNDNTAKQVIVGGLYPFQPAGSNTPNNVKGIVDWMGGPQPQLSTDVARTLMQLDELWVWDDDRGGWATFQQVGDDMLLWGKHWIANMMAWNTSSLSENPALVDMHPFNEFCCTPLDDYFWGRSEITNVALLQEALNARINGINKLLRLQEQPPTKFVGATGVNQQALSRFNKPGGYWNDVNPNAKIESQPPTMPRDEWGSLHEYERMFDEMGGLPPLAKGHGEAGVRSAGHAETLVRMFSPRFKDRALLIERNVEGLGATSLELAKAHCDKQLIAWVPEGQAGLEGEKPNPLIVPPAPGQVQVRFSFADLAEDATLTIDSHSSSPAFAMEEKALWFDLFKIKAASADDVVQHVDVSDPEELSAGIQRRQVAEAQAAQQQEALKVLHGGKK